MNMTSISMPEFAEWLSGPMSSPVVDETKLSGKFDLTIDVAPFQPSGASPADQEDAFITAMREQLGLKLERRTSHIEVLVVDHLERIPTEN